MIHKSVPFMRIGINSSSLTYSKLQFLNHNFPMKTERKMPSTSKQLQKTYRKSAEQFFERKLVHG